MIWFTGLSGAGKSTLAAALCDRLRRDGISAEHLDGDEVRRRLGGALGFSRPEREEQTNRLSYLAQLLSRQGVAVVVSAISPRRGARARARRNVGDFIEVHVNTPLEVCERRDPKGLYRRARAGEIADFTGISAPYEPPLDPEVECDTEREGLEGCLAKIWVVVRARIGATHPAAAAVAASVRPRPPE